jgi:hypothetical protein
MFVDFDDLPGSARVWIYQADRKFNETEAKLIHAALTPFTSEWAAHGTPLRSSYKILQDQFVLLAVDEQVNDASGCSIDTSVHVMKALGEAGGIDFFNRGLVAFLIDNEIVLLAIGELKQKYVSGVWNGQTPTFNILAQRVDDVRRNWILPAEKSWVSRYMEPKSMDSLAR